MEKIKFTIQILVLILAFPVWFFAETAMPGKAMKSVEINNNDSIQLKKAAFIKTGKTDADLDPKTAAFGMHILVCN